MVWLEDDLAAQSVADRLTMFRKHLGEKVHDYSVFEDRVRLLVDTDQDTVADKVVTFADGFNEIEDGTGAGVLAINGDVYYTCIPNLWLLKDINDDGHADVKKTLHSGYGVRVAFRGHDMHGLTLGPDGRIYFSMVIVAITCLRKKGIVYIVRTAVPFFDVSEMVQAFKSLPMVFVIHRNLLLMTTEIFSRETTILILVI